MNKSNRRKHMQNLKGMAEIPQIQQRAKNSYQNLEPWKTDLFSDVFLEAERKAEEKWEEYPEVVEEMGKLYEEFSVIPELLEGDAERKERILSAKEMNGLLTYLFLENKWDYMIKYEIYLKGVRDGHRLKKFLRE